MSQAQVAPGMIEMAEYEFTLKFRLPEQSGDAGAFLAALAEAGCDDALVGVGQHGRIALDFSREAATALAAVTSAVRDVRKAIPGAELVEASPDLVGLTEVAELVDCSRQNMRKLMLANPDFPPAVHDGAQSLWHLHVLLDWFAATQRRQVDQSLLDLSEATMTLNIAREARRLRGAVLPKNLERLFA